MAIICVSVVYALAGTGKTTTLEIISNFYPNKKGLYLVFGKANKDEAKARFPKNIKVMNVHGLTYSIMKRRNILNKKIAINSDEKGEYFTSLSGKSIYLNSGEFKAVSDSYNITGEGEYKFIATKYGMNYIRKGNYKESEIARMFKIDYKLAKKVLSTFDGFLNSHLVTINKTKNKATFYTYKLFELMIDGSIAITHNFYLKYCQMLMKKDIVSIEYDFLMMDEAQDSNMVTLSICDLIIAKNKVFVGDDNQQIYSFRGSINAMDKLITPNIFTLSETFRFPINIADKTNLLLKKFKNSSLLLKSNVEIDDRFNLEDKDIEHCEKIKNELERCYISRSNSGLIARMVMLIKEKKKFKTVRPPNEIFSLAEELIYLKSFQRDKIYEHKYLLDHKCYEDAESYAKSVKDVELLSGMAIVKNYEKVLTMLKDTASKYYDEYMLDSSGFKDFLTTAHTCKGFEWEYICLEDSFPNFIGLIEETGVESIEEFREKIKEHDSKIVDEFNLFYVAMTRTMKSIEIYDENEFFLELEDWELNELIAAYREALEAAMNDDVPFEFNPREILGYEEREEPGMVFESIDKDEIEILANSVSNTNENESKKDADSSANLFTNSNNELIEKNNKKKEALVNFASELTGWCEPYIKDGCLYINNENVGFEAWVGVRIGNGIRIHPMEIFIDDGSIKIKNETKWIYSDITVFDLLENIPESVLANSQADEDESNQKNAELILEKIKSKAIGEYTFSKEITVNINLTLNKTVKDYKDILLGQAMIMDDKRYIIFLDEKPIENYGNKYLKEVITHEYAHILHWCIYG